MAQCGDVTAGPYSAAPYDITFEYTEESQVVVYYIVNRIEIIVPQNDPNYPWSFQHATRITFTSAVPPQPVYIRRSTDVTPLKAEFQTGNAIRAQDLNKNFQQIADACNENQADFKCLTNDLESVIQNIQTTIQYTAVSNVAALNTAAATNPDDQVGYDVLDSTGVDTLANPIISGLPATAGGGVGEDPVNGVYWNSGIITRVSWDRTAQNWDFISYYSRNGDNRYQQLTLASPITPNPDDYKDGTLWFDSGDANLYMLYNDGNSRQWVITNPLSAYGQIVTTSDVHWNRNAQTNTVYPKNSTDTIANNNGSATIDSSGAAVFTSVTSSGAISGTTITGSGAISGTTITGSGAVSGDSVAATNAVTGASVTATGNISSATLNTTGNVGIGTTLPNSYSNYNTLTLDGTTGGSVDFESNGTLMGQIYSTASLFRLDAVGAATDTTFITNGTERMRIDSSGRLLVGLSTARTGFFNTNSITPKFQVETNGPSADGRFMSLVSNPGASADYTPTFLFGKTRSTTAGGTTGVASGDELGAISFQGADGSHLVESARIAALVDGTTGTDDIPGRLVFSTTADGESSPTERMRIDSSGLVGIGTTTPTPANANDLSLHIHNSGTSGVVGSEVRFTNGICGQGASAGGLITYYNQDLYMWNYGAKNLIFGTTGTSRLIINSSGLLTLPSGSPGIQFGNSNTGTNISSQTLDDYEEGTFTPTWVANGVTFTYATDYKHGWYTKIGNKVYFTLYISSASTPSGTTSSVVYIDGLPFTTANTGNIYQAATIGFTYKINWLSNTKRVTAGLPNGNNRIYFFWGYDNANDVTATAAMLTNYTYLIISGSYIAA